MHSASNTKPAPTTLHPLLTLYLYDRPMLFTARVGPSLCLVLVDDTSGNETFYVAATPSITTLQRILANTLHVRAGFETGPFYLIHEVPDTPLAIQQVNHLATTSLPSPNTLLRL